MEARWKRQIPARDGYLASEAVGEIERDGKVLVVRRIHVSYHLQLRPEHRAAAERVLAIHADNCPVYRTIRGCVDITTSLETEEISAAARRRC